MLCTTLILSQHLSLSYNSFIRNQGKQSIETACSLFFVYICWCSISQHHRRILFALMDVTFLVGFALFDRFMTHRKKEVSRKLDEAKEAQKIDERAERSSVRATQKQHHVQARDHKKSEKRVHTIVHHNIQQPPK